MFCEINVSEAEENQLYTSTNHYRRQLYPNLDESSSSFHTLAPSVNSDFLDIHSSLARSTTCDNFQYLRPSALPSSHSILSFRSFQEQDVTKKETVIVMDRAPHNFPRKCEQFTISTEAADVSSSTSSSPPTSVRVLVFERCLLEKSGTTSYSQTNSKLSSLFNLIPFVTSSSRKNTSWKLRQLSLDIELRQLTLQRIAASKTSKFNPFSSYKQSSTTKRFFSLRNASFDQKNAAPCIKISSADQLFTCRLLLQSGLELSLAFATRNEYDYWCQNLAHAVK